MRLLLTSICCIALTGCVSVGQEESYYPDKDNPDHELYGVKTIPYSLNFPESTDVASEIDPQIICNDKNSDLIFTEEDKKFLQLNDLKGTCGLIKNLKLEDHIAMKNLYKIHANYYGEEEDTN